MMTTNPKAIEAIEFYLRHQSEMEPAIQASATPTTLSIEATAPVEIQAAQGEGKRPTFELVGYTGAVMSVAGFYSPVIVDLTGLKASRERIPIFLDHDSSRIIGQATPTIDASSVRLSGTITGDDADAQKVIVHAKNGFEWQASIGATIVRQEFLKAGETATVNGREVHGPLLIAREARLQETSFVAIGADGQTSANVAASNPSGTHDNGDHRMNFEQWVQAKGFDPASLNDAQKASLKAAYDAEQALKAAPAPTPTPTPTPEPAKPPEPKRLDDIFAKARQEENRQAQITELTAHWVRERPLLIDTLEKMSRSAIEAKSSPDEFKLAVLEVVSTNPANNSHFAIHASDRKVGAKMVEAALCLSGGLSQPEKHFDEQTLNAASERFSHGFGLVEVLMMAARENGHSSISPRDVNGLLKGAFAPQVQASGFSTMSLPGILSNVANKFVRMGFMNVESVWRQIAATRPVSDFKQIQTYAVTGDFEYEQIGPAGEIKHGTVGELEYTNKAESYARMFAITFQDIRNDDIGALTAVPQRIGRGGALILNKKFWTEFMDNATFFTTARGNAIEGVTVGTDDSRLNIEGLTRAEAAFFDQTDPDGQPLGVNPVTLLVPNALNAVASQLMNSTEIRDTTASTLFGISNPHAGKFTIARSSYLSNSTYTGNSTTAWYLLASPSDTPVIEVVFLDGRDSPMVESADADFNTLGIQMRGLYHFGVRKQEYRGGVRAKGAA